MPRPRAHDDRTAAALLDAAEAIVARSGPHALSVRNVAAEVGASTRAVYSVFGSKGGLLGGIAERAFGFLHDELAALPVTDDPAADLVACGAQGYRRFVTERPSLFRITFQRAVPGLQLTDELVAARARAFAQLEWRVEQVARAGRLARGDIRAAAVEFNAMCEGLANAQLRGGTLRILPEGEEERAWREGLETVVLGLTAARG